MWYITTYTMELHIHYPLGESLSITTGRCNLAIATRARKMH